MAVQRRSVGATSDPRFTPQQWEELQNAVMYAFLLVTAPDGKITRLKSAMLIKFFENAHQTTGPDEQLFVNVLLSCEHAKEAVLERAMRAGSAGRTPQQSLNEVVSILQLATEEESLVFRADIVAIAAAIAKNGKFVPRLTPQEAHAVEEVALALGFTG